jgi:TIR domain
MARAIFISYRRDDTEGEAGRLFDDLVRTYGDNSVFMDVAGINPGIDFRKAIEDNVATCGVLLAMIGPTWASITDSSGQRRLEDPNDFVRREIAAALARDIAVIPVLVHDAKMPRPEQLPDDLKNLAYRNSVQITHARWNSDVELLTRALGRYVTSSSYTSTEPVHATAAVQLPPPNAPEHKAAAASSSKTAILAAVAVAVVLAIGAGAFFAFHKPAASSTVETPPAPTPKEAPAAVPATSPTPETAPAATPAVAAATRQASPLAGTWINPGNNGVNEGLKKLEITATGIQLSIHAWANCKPVDCDWGKRSTTFDGHQATAAWSMMLKQGGKELDRVATVTMVPASNGLGVTVANIYGKTPAKPVHFTFNRSQ